MDAVGQPFVVPSARFGWRYQEDALVFIRHHNIFAGMPLLLTGVLPFVTLTFLGTLHAPLRTIDEDILYFRKLLQKLFHGRDLPLWQYDLLA